MKNFLNKIIAGRQDKADREIARFLHSSEFRNESYDFVLDKVKNNEIHEILS